MPRSVLFDNKFIIVTFNSLTNQLRKGGTTPYPRNVTNNWKRDGICDAMDGYIRPPSLIFGCDPKPLAGLSVGRKLLPFTCCFFLYKAVVSRATGFDGTVGPRATTPCLKCISACHKICEATAPTTICFPYYPHGLKENPFLMSRKQNHAR